MVTTIVKSYVRSLALLVCLTSGAEFARAAGADSSGGGLGVVCFDNPAILETLRQGDGLLTDELLPHITSIENFDLYEANLVRGINMDLKQKVVPLKDNETADEYVERILKRMDFSVPALARLVRKTVEELSQAGHVEHVMRPLERMNDARQVGLIDYENCMLATMGLNRLEKGEGVLQIDKRIYAHAKQSEQSRAIFLLHEYVYITARKLGHTDSRHTRVLINSLITSHAQLTTKFLAGKAFEFGFSGKEAFPTYAHEIVLPIVRGILEKTLEAFKETRPEAKRLIVEANKALKGSGIQCQYKYFISHCKQTLEGLKDPKLSEMIAKFDEFSDKRTRLIGKAVWIYYATDEVRGSLLNAPGIPTDVKTQMEEHLREKVIKQILVWFIDTGINHPDYKPIDEVDLKKLARDFTDELEKTITYSIGVFE